MEIVRGLSKKVAAIWQRHKSKKDFARALVQAASDGVLSDTEIYDLEARSTALGLTGQDLKSVRAQAYAAALQATRSDGIVTSEEEAELNKLQSFLEISDVDIARSKKELARLRLLAEIQNGNPPIVSAPNVILQKSECAHWVEAGTILEERVVRRRYEGGSHGVSFRIAKGVSYRVGAHRGHLVSDKEIVPVRPIDGTWCRLIGVGTHDLHP